MASRLKLDKKNAQEEIKRLLADRKRKIISKIDNPLAKYTKAGDLMCILCSSIVKSEHVWKVHLNSKQHRENVENAKKLKELTNNFTVNKVKHKTTNEDGVPPQKKLKGILKNSSQTSADPQSNEALQYPLVHNDEIKRNNISVISHTTVLEHKIDDKSKSITQTDTTNTQGESSDQPIPEGFFDDPVLDAKIRNIEYKDPIEEEWEKFQKEMKEEASASAEIIAGEQEEATAERQIDEIDEQIRIWSRVLDLELKKEEAKTKHHHVENSNDNSEASDEDTSDENNIDEFLDWRSKKSFT